MKKQGYFIISGIVILNIIVVVLFMLNKPWEPLSQFSSFFVRLFSLLGLVALFISSIFSLFTKELYQIFKKSFIKIHHASAYTGLVLMTLHPIVFGIDQIEQSSVFINGLKVFLPDFSSHWNFWRLAGRPALIIFILAIVGALIRRSFKKGWRWIHALNYIAFAFVVIHGVLNGSDFYGFNLYQTFVDTGAVPEAVVAQKLIMTILALLMLLAVIVTFVVKRVREAKRRQMKKAKLADTNKEEVTEETDGEITNE